MSLPEKARRELVLLMLLRTRGRATLADVEPMMEATLGANMRAADIMMCRGVCEEDLKSVEMIGLFYKQFGEE